MAVTHNQMLAEFGGMFAELGGTAATLAALCKRRKS